MSTPIELSSQRFADWLRSTEEHADARLALLEQAERLLENPAAGGREFCGSIAGKLERWRYQHLNRCSNRLTAEDRALLDALDLAANDLRGGDSRPPRWPRGSVLDSSCRDDAIEEAERRLDRAAPLAEIEERAAAITRAVFGQTLARRWRVLLYAPLYLSNLCINHCRYCGFRHPNEIFRKHLTKEEALREADVLRSRGFRHILLVAGDFPQLTTTEYFVDVLRSLCDREIVPAVEIAPQTTESYAAMADAGAHGVTLYQETYDETLYSQYHPRGTKTAYDWRLEGLERAAEAGVKRLGLGPLLGLAEPREELLALMRHGRYLASRFPDRTLAFSLPRIHEAPSGFQVPYLVDDDLFLRMYCALRVAFPRAELVLSTRERPELRDRLAKICITQLSAGSCTAPGGYLDEAGRRSGEQFPVCDSRSPKEVADWLSIAGFEPVWDLRQ